MRKREKKERGERKRVNRVRERENKEGKRIGMEGKGEEKWQRKRKNSSKWEEGNAKSVNVGFKYFMPLSHN